jgi:hypothetical protein
MTIPVQRGPESDGTGRVLGIVVESLRRLDDSVSQLSRDVNTQLSRLPNDYVPRREVERRFDELTVDVGELRLRADAAAKTREDRDREDARERATARRWRIGLVLASGMSATGVVSGIVLHFQ